MANNPNGFVRDGQLYDLIERIYATVQHPELWTPVIAAISEALGGDSIAIYAGFPNSATPALLAMNASAADAWQPFEQYYAHINPIMPRAVQKLEPGTTWYSQDVIGDAELECTEFYNDFYKPNDMHYSLGLRIPLWGVAEGSLSCQRSKAAGVFDPRVDFIVQTLKPHIQRALLLRHQLSGLQIQAVGLGQALDALDQGVLCLGHDAGVVFANGRAESILSEGASLKLVNGKLRATQPTQDAMLQCLLTAAVDLTNPSQTPLTAALRMSRSNGSAALRLTVAPYRSSRNSLTRDIGALVFLYDLDRKPAARGDLLKILYDLTPTEVRVAEYLIAGLQARELAGEMAITLETARFHVKRVLAKTGTRRQTEFMRLMLTLPGL